VMFLHVPELLDEVQYKRIRLKPSKPHAVVRLFKDAPSDKFREGQMDAHSRMVAPYSSLVTFGKVDTGFHMIPCEYIADTAIVVPNMPMEVPQQQPLNRTREKTQKLLNDKVAALGEGYFVIGHRCDWGDAFGKLIESFDPTT